MKQCCVGLAGCGFEGIAEEIEADVRIERGGAWSGDQLLFGEPFPSKSVVGKGEMRGFGGICAYFAGKPGSVGGQIEEADLGSIGSNGHLFAWRSVALERIGQSDCAVSD